MGFASILSFAHQLVQQRVRAGDTVIDATAGSGNDTLFLARLVGDKGLVVAFDVQQEALEATRQRLAEAGVAVVDELDGGAGHGVRLVQASHAEMGRYVRQEVASKAVCDRAGFGTVAAVMFNLGYLPGASNMRVITSPSSTLPALDAAMSLLRPGGVLTVAVYPGHAGGAEEASAVEAWASALPHFAGQVLLYRFANRQISSPYLIAIEKLNYGK